MTTEQEAAETAETPLELPVMLLDREIYVRMPTPEQILVWQRTINRLTEAPMDASWTGSQVMNALERLRKIVDTLITNRADVDWLDDQFLEGTVDFRGLAPWITTITQTFQEHAAATGNREQRRAAVKKTAAKKTATRRAPR